MAIQFNMIPGTLFHPTDTFNKLKEKATFNDGLTLYLIIAVISAIISIITSFLLRARNLAELDSIYRSYSAYGYGASYNPYSSMNWAYSDVWIIVSAIISIVVGLVAFLAISWLIAKLTKSISNGTGDFGKTVALLAYLQAAVFLLISLPLTLISTMANLSLPVGVGIYSNIGVAIGIIVLALLFLVWLLIISGKAVAAANDVSLGGGIAAIIVAGLIVFVVFFVIGLILGMIILFSMASSFSSLGAFSLGGL